MTHHSKGTLCHVGPSQGGVEILAEVVMGRHHNQETAHRFALSALWNLAFNERSKQVRVRATGISFHSQRKQACKRASLMRRWCLPAASPRRAYRHVTWPPMSAQAGACVPEARGIHVARQHSSMSAGVHYDPSPHLGRRA